MVKGLRLVTLVLALGLSLASVSAEAESSTPYETGLIADSTNPIDKCVRDLLDENGIRPANRCSDAVFVRRVYLDVIGTLPEPQTVRSFLEDSSPDKRAALIESLLERDEFNRYQALKWGDLLRIKAEFPINLWPNAVQAYHRWVYESIRDNKSYDQFARDLLTSSGSNFRTPQVNFYRAMEGHEPATIAAAVALTFMGVRIETWPEEQRQNLEKFFARVAFKSTAEWKEEIVCLDPAPASAMDAVFPDGKSVHIEPDQDPRTVFADWLIDPENPWFTRNIANRVWSWTMGRGIIQEPDDIRPDNPPSNPALLTCLEKELIRSGYDLRSLMRLILNSETYQQSSIPSVDPNNSERLAQAEALFAVYPVRQLDAEVLIDAINTITGTREEYSSPIPEPYTFIPEYQRSIDLADGSITSPFLELFGRPARDTGLESERNNTPDDAQRLHLLNSSHIQKKIEDSNKLRRLIQRTGKNRRDAIRTLYLNILSRYPTTKELAQAEDYFQTGDINPRQALNDVAWALINNREFLYRH